NSTGIGKHRTYRTHRTRGWKRLQNCLTKTDIQAALVYVLFTESMGQFGSLPSRNFPSCNLRHHLSDAIRKIGFWFNDLFPRRRLALEPRRSGSKSQTVKSTPCRPAEITGFCERTIARAIRSSLKGQRSSFEPPPRATIMTSTSVDPAQVIDAFHNLK